MANEERSASPKEKEVPARRFTRARANAAEHARIREELRDVDFPIGLRGYERAAVDRYVERANRLIAELEVSSSPEAAVNHALEEVSEETRGILQRAHETADEITARSRARADDRLQQGEREAKEALEKARGEAEQLKAMAQKQADEIRGAAEARVRELEAKAEAISRERERLLNDMNRVAQQLLEIARTETAEQA